MKARRRGSLVPFLDREDDHELDGDLAHKIYQQALLLTRALDGLRLNEFNQDADWWRERVSTAFILSLELEDNAQRLHEQIGKEQQKP